jgi:hypothetical protein
VAQPITHRLGILPLDQPGPADPGHLCRSRSRAYQGARAGAGRGQEAAVEPWPATDAGQGPGGHGGAGNGTAVAGPLVTGEIASGYAGAMQLHALGDRACTSL